MTTADFSNKNKSSTFNYKSDKAPMDRWNDDDMTHDGKLYDITVIKNNDKTSKKVYKLLIDGAATDPDMSLLPMNISNTVLIPNDILRCRAGGKVSFTIETRTTNPSMVTVAWELDTRNAIKLIFN